MHSFFMMDIPLLEARTMGMGMKGEAPLTGKKNKGEGAAAAKILTMTHNRKHNPDQAPVQSKRITPSAEKSSP